VLILLLFVRNTRALFELLLYRNVVRELEFRFGLGRHDLNLDDMIIFAELILNRIYCYKVDGKVVARFNDGLILLPDRGYVSALTEPFEKMYKVFNFRGRVLDVGGYLGETAFLFKKWGAAEVVVYEPDHFFAQYVRNNLLLNGVKGIVHEAFVDDSCSDKSISWAKVLQEKFDVAKVDCEGCENSLLNLPEDFIKKVPKWVLECHSSHTLRQLGNKFLAAGFTVTFKPYLGKHGYAIFGRQSIFYPQIKIPEGFTFIMIARMF
jgi:predicted RNA methylase